MLAAAEALQKLAGEELRGAQAEHLEDEAAAKVLLHALLWCVTLMLITSDGTCSVCICKCAGPHMIMPPPARFACLAHLTFPYSACAYQGAGSSSLQVPAVWALDNLFSVPSFFTTMGVVTSGHLSFACTGFVHPSAIPGAMVNLVTH